MRQKVEFYAWRERRQIVDIPAAFRFRKDRPAHWLQKVCCFVMEKLKAFDTEYTIKVTRHTVDTRSFVDRLFRQQAELCRMLNDSADVVLMGSEDYEELMLETVGNRQFEFRAEYLHTRRIMGMTVKVIPWMKGILVLPKGVV